MSLSVCNRTLDNIGTINCSPVIEDAIKFIFVPTFDATGARNKLSSSVLFTPALLQALIDQADATKRWYPTPVIDNIGGERAASTFQTGSSGRKYKSQTGIRGVEFEIFEQWAQFQAALESYQCSEMSFYEVDSKHNLIGNVLATDDGYLYPTRISKDSMDIILMKPKPDTSLSLKVSFEIDRREKDSLLRMIQASEMTADVSECEGLNNVYSTISAIATTGFTAALYAKHGSSRTTVPITGLVIGDFYDVRGGAASKVYNVTDSAALALVSVTESVVTPGTYVFVYLAQTSADVIRLTPVKTQLDFTAVVASTILTP